MKDSGYLLSYVRYGDHDAILHCFTKENGFQSFFVRGIYAAKSKKKAYLAPLNELIFIANDQNKSGLSNITKIEQVIAVESSDVKASAVVFFIAEFLHQVLKKETAQERIYQAIRVFLQELEKGNFQAHYLFLVEFLSIQGILPLMGEGKFLNPEMGCFEGNLCHQLLNEEISSLWKKCLTEAYIYDVKIDKNLKTDFLDTILLYYHFHFPEFKTPKSLDILKEVFFS